MSDFEATVTKAAQAVYANTKTGQFIEWKLLPKNVQEEMRTIARTAITVALLDLKKSIEEDTK